MSSAISGLWDTLRNGASSFANYFSPSSDASNTTTSNSGAAQQEQPIPTVNATQAPDQDHTVASNDIDDEVVNAASQEVQSVMPANADLQTRLIGLLDKIDVYNKKAQRIFTQTEKVRAKKNKIEELRSYIISNNVPNGGINCTGNTKVCQLFTDCRNMGIAIANKTVFSAEERQSLLEKLRHFSDNLETDMKLKMHEFRKQEELYNELLKMLKDLLEKYRHTVNQVIAKVGQSYR